MPDEPQIIELMGDEWSLSLDKSAAPEYVILALQGKASTARTQARLELLRGHMPHMPDGRWCPLIADQREQAPPSLNSLKAARAFMETLSPQVSYLVFLVGPERLHGHLMDMNREMLDRVLPGRYVFVTSLEEAQTYIRAFHERQG